MSHTIPEFSNHEYWEQEVSRFIEHQGGIGEETLSIWKYFKYCLATTNHFFFRHQLIDTIISKLHSHCFDLQSGTVLYRARIDHDEKKDSEAGLYYLYKTIPDKIEWLRNYGADEITVEEFKNELLSIAQQENFPIVQTQIESGFEGFDAQESGAPPAGKAASGRCNSAGVPFLYAAKEEHTAIAEVRPLIRSSISMATIVTNKELKLIDFYYEFDEDIDDSFYHYICLEFSRLNKGNKDDYLTTQYITSLIEYLGYDGIRFRSSLVENGTNYVIFEHNNYQVKSSKLYQIYDVKYDFESSYIIKK